MASGSNLFGSRLFKSCKLWGDSSKDKTCLSSTSHRCSIGFRSGEVSRSTLQTHHSSKHFCPLPCYRGHSTQIKSTTMIMFILCVCDHCRQEHPFKSTPTSVFIMWVLVSVHTEREIKSVATWQHCCDVVSIESSIFSLVSRYLPWHITLLFSHFARVKIEISIHSPFLLADDFPTEGVSGLQANAHRIHLVLCILCT